jgi:hypothetical protein
MKKFILHIDALVVLILVFSISLSFNFYQRYQYSDLLQDHIKLQVDTQKKDFSLSFMEVNLKKCNESLVESSR